MRASQPPCCCSFHLLHPLLHSPTTPTHSEAEAAAEMWSTSRSIVAACVVRALVEAAEAVSAALRATLAAALLLSAALWAKRAQSLPQQAASWESSGQRRSEGYPPTAPSHQRVVSRQSSCRLLARPGLQLRAVPPLPPLPPPPERRVSQRPHDALATPQSSGCLHTICHRVATSREQPAAFVRMVALIARADGIGVSALSR